MEHFEQAREMWETLVPQTGEADTVQGELLRAVERLRDEARQNGNINWDEDDERCRYPKFLAFLRRTLPSLEVFPPAHVAQILQDLDRLADYQYPETDDELYDRLADRVVEWRDARPSPIPLSDAERHAVQRRTPLRGWRALFRSRPR